MPFAHNSLDSKDLITTSASAVAVPVHLDFLQLACTTPSDCHWSEDSIRMDGVCVCGVCGCVCVRIVHVPHILWND